MNKRINQSINEWLNVGMTEQLNEWPNEWLSEWANVWVSEWVNVWVWVRVSATECESEYEWVWVNVGEERLCILKGRWVSWWVGAWMCACVSEWLNERTNEWMNEWAMFSPTKPKGHAQGYILCSCYVSFLQHWQSGNDESESSYFAFHGVRFWHVLIQVITVSFAASRSVLYMVYIAYVLAGLWCRWGWEYVMPMCLPFASSTLV